MNNRQTTALLLNFICPGFGPMYYADLPVTITTFYLLFGGFIFSLTFDGTAKIIGLLYIIAAFIISWTAVIYRIKRENSQ